MTEKTLGHILDYHMAEWAGGTGLEWLSRGAKARAAFETAANAIIMAYRTYRLTEERRNRIL